MSDQQHSTKPSAYEHDFYAWTAEQAALLRAGRVAELDLDHIAEEIETLGRGEKREFVSRLAVLLLHLLIWRFQAGLRGRSWELTVVEQRRASARHLNENPSLRPWRFEAIADAYGDALIRAEKETGMLRDMFPWACPFSFEQIMDDDFWPEPD